MDIDSKGHEELGMSTEVPFRQALYRTESDDIPWELQCEALSMLFSTVHDCRLSSSSRGRAYLLLSIYYATGLGCKRDISQSLRYFHLAASFGCGTSGIMAPQIFSAHGRCVPELELEDYSIDNQDSFVDTETENSDTNNQSCDSTEDDDESMGSVGSNVDDRLIIFAFAKCIDEKLRSPETASTEYYCDMIKSFQGEVFVHWNGRIQFTLGRDKNRWYNIDSRSDDSNLLEQFISERNLTQDGSTLAQFEVGDGTTFEIPLLHYAINCGKFSLVKKLIANGANIDDRDETGQTALHAACRVGLTNITTYLIDLGAKATAADYTGVTPLHWLWMFPENDMEEVATALVNCAGSQLNILTGKNSRVLEDYFLRMVHTPLHVAVRVGSTKAVTTLLKLGADPNYRPDDSSDTPLESAVRYHLPKVVSILLDNGAQLQPSECARQTWALHHVGQYTPPIERWLLHGPDFKHVIDETIRILLLRGSNSGLGVDTLAADGSTPLQYVLDESGEDIYVMEALLRNGAVMPPDALILAVNSYGPDQQNAAKVEAVISHGAAIASSAEDDGFTALHYSALNGSLKVMESIIRCHPDGRAAINIPNEDGEVPLHCATSRGHLSMTRLLVEEGANINAVDKDGRTPICGAISSGVQDVTEFLLNRRVDLLLHGGDWKGASVLHYAVNRKQYQAYSMLQYLLSSDLEEDQPQRFPVLHDSVILDAADENHKNTALHIATLHGDYNGVFSLIMAGASTHLLNSRKNTPADEALLALERMEQQEQHNEPLIESLKDIYDFLCPDGRREDLYE
ncbi:ankyrin repeat-containing domain protein [Trichophaea hybrida]|nr:ankyrin repeat-containing domain protein [Trichophaea hybrida]